MCGKGIRLWFVLAVVLAATGLAVPAASASSSGGLLGGLLPPCGATTYPFNAWGDSGADLAHLRIPGVLQMIGVAGLLGAFLVWCCRSRVEVVAAAGFGLVAVHAAEMLTPRTSDGAGLPRP